MKKLEVEDIHRMRADPAYLDEVYESMCLLEFNTEHVNEKNFIVHVNFVMVSILIALKKDYIGGSLANHLLNKVDALYDSTDMLPFERIIQKLNSEIVEDMLGVPYFNKIAIMCDEINVGY